VFACVNVFVRVFALVCVCLRMFARVCMCLRIFACALGVCVLKRVFA